MDTPQQIAPSSLTIDAAAIGAGASVDSSSVLRTGAELFLRNGCLIVRNAFEPKLIETLQREFTGGYSRYFQDRHFPDALRVGDKRTMITLRVENTFNTPGFYANPRIFSLLRYLLGDAMIMGSMGAVCSLPGAGWQHQHRDHANIFDSTMVYPGGDACYASLPPYAITVVVPLVSLNEATGSTRLWPGSHLKLDRNALDGESLDPMVEPGDCYLMDYRLMHGGMPNRSQLVRPIIYNVYYRPWFRDCQNYPLQAPLSMSAVERGKVPPAYRGLFDWSFARTNASGTAAAAAGTTLATQNFYPQPSLTVRI
jgi:hypothetical protein